MKNTDIDYAKPALKNVKAFFSVGIYDYIATRPFFQPSVAAVQFGFYDYVYGLGGAGVPIKIKMDLPYGHQWSQWREVAVYAFDTFLWK
jgi:hypothetical protein